METIMANSVIPSKKKHTLHIPIKQHKNKYTHWHQITISGLHQWSYSIYMYKLLYQSYFRLGDVVVVSADVVVVVVEETQAVLFPECTRYHFLLQEEFLEELVTQAHGEEIVDEVHEAHARPRIVAGLRVH